MEGAVEDMAVVAAVVVVDMAVVADAATAAVADVVVDMAVADVVEDMAVADVVAVDMRAVADAAVAVVATKRPMELLHEQLQLTNWSTVLHFEGSLSNIMYLSNV